MSFITDLINKITNFRVKIGDKLNTLKSQIGQLNLLTTNDKTSLVGAVNEVNNIQIGGRNLALNSEQPIWNPNNFGLGTSVKMDDSTGKFTRISADVGKNVSVFGFYVEGSNLGDHSRSMYFRPQGSSATVWGKTIPADVWTLVKDEGFTSLNGYSGFETNVRVIDVKKFKLEKGNKATDWSPAFEDQVSNWAETDNNSLSFIKGKEIVNNEFNNVYNQINARANNRLSNLASDLTPGEKGTIRDKIGVVPPTVNDGKLTLTTGTGLNGSTNFTANQSSNSIFDVSIASTHKLPSTAEFANTLKKDESNIVTENFSIERNYSNGDTFSMDVRATPSGYGEMSIGVSDDNAEGVRFLFSSDNIKMRGVNGGDDSMVMDGDKITFAQYSPNKTSNDLAQMQDLDNLKQWIINNFLSLNGGTVNGDIFANKFEEN